MSDLTPFDGHPLDEFDELTAQLPQLSPFQVMWNEAEEMLLEYQPQGFEPEEIGRIAFDCLPDEEKPAALDALFHCWWAAVQSDREALARHQASQEAGR